MKTHRNLVFAPLLAGLALLLAVAGCVSSSTSKLTTTSSVIDPATIDPVEVGARSFAAAAVYAILRNNPEEIPVVRALAADIPAQIAAHPSWTPDGISSYLGDFCARHQLGSTRTQAYLDLGTLFYGQLVPPGTVALDMTDPRFRAAADDFVAGCGLGINAALVFPKK